MFRRNPQKPCRSQRVANWGLAFESMLEDPIGLKTFTEFLKREFSAENIMFWIACKQYGQLTDRAQMKKQAREIYEHHLRAGAPEAININSHSRQAVRTNLQAAPCDLFAQAEKEIFTLMKFDCYQRFLKSDLYIDCLTAEKLGKPVPCTFSPVTQSPGKTRFRSKSRDRNRIEHIKKANSTNYSINKTKENNLSINDNCSDAMRSSLSCATDINVLWNRLQERLDDQRGTGLKCEIPDFLLH